MILIALGANLPSSFGSPRQSLERAVREISKCGLTVLYQSPVYLTAPVPVSDQPWYHNAVIGVSTDKSPRQVLDILQSIEQEFGRVRTVRNAPRVIDLDIIAYHDVVVNDDDLIIPHPRMQDRAFVLYPLRDIAPRWVHPVLKKPVMQMIDEAGTQDIQKEPRPLVMGIVNVTPDSFSDGGKYHTADTAIAHGLKLIEEGADILDIGGESTRPDAQPVSPYEEQCRIIPVIEGLKNSGALISVDTRHASTMAAALSAGAGMVNDVTALTGDARSMDVVTNSDCRICLMHMQGTPQTMQANPQYNDVVNDIFRYLQGRIDDCVAQGIAPERLVVDVGIGFGKTTAHNLELFKNLSRFRDLGVDVLLGASRKRFIPELCGADIAPSDRLPGSLAAVGAACRAGAQVVRVHDVAATRQFINVFQKICV